ncbi:hypothetical protein MUK42_19255 [Musa troglodytarum]|uniref:Uncharacterized protein n=1 Tax=Musa troglodytarum TaxID=320322 RepID=A0A9E7G6I4_9LILI|nr:hypothetical protein MUK42_19255 [Musa troglodytarum]
MVFLSTWKALARTSSEMGGLDPNTASATVMVPGFWLLRAPMATVLVYPGLNWKWMRPSGNTNTSPFFSILVKRRLPLSVLDVTKPTKSCPSMTVRISVAPGSE